MQAMVDKVKDYFSNLSPLGYFAWGSLLVVVVAVIWVVGAYVGTRNDGIEQELGLARMWNTMEARYSQGRAGIVDQLGIAAEKRDAMNKLLQTAIEGRGFGGSEKGKVDGQKFVSAVQEAYPDLKGLNIYDKLLRQVQAMRKAFADDQSQMADQIRAYDKWRTTGSLLHPMYVQWLGFPSDHLVIRVGDKSYKGREALDKLSAVIMTGDAAQIFNEGKDKQIQTH